MKGTPTTRSDIATPVQVASGGMGRRSLIMLWVALVALAVPAASVAAPGALDGSFGVGGISVLDLGRDERASSVALQPDGGVIVVGSSEQSTPPVPSDVLVARVLGTTGALDPAFSSGATPGYSLFNLGAGDYATDVVLQPDGRILIGGGDGTADFTVLRVLPVDGTLDPSFGPASTPGRTTFGLAPGKSEYGTNLALQSDGKIVVGGSGYYSTTQDLEIARILNPGGTRDPSYGAGIGSVINFGGQEYGGKVALQSDGKILIAGTSGGGFAVARVDVPLGTLDTSFDSDGKATVNLGGGRGASDIAVQSDGKILVSGSGGAQDVEDFAVARLLPGGSLDPTFGVGGKATVDFGADDVSRAMAVQPDGKIVLAGVTRPAAGEAGNMAITRLGVDGSLDTTFGQGGKTTIDLGAAEGAEDVALRPDGKTIVVGASGPAGSIATRGARTRRAPSTDFDVVVARLDGAEVIGPPVPAPTGRPVKCAGKKATVVGTPKGEKLKGTKRNDVIAGFGGNDRIFGFGGKDIICGGAGKDRLFGGAGKDKIYGQAGRDVLRGGPAKDVLRGGPGKDSQKP